MFARLRLLTVSGCLFGLTLVPPLAMPASAQGMPDCQSPTALHEIQYTNGWCYESSMGFFYNPYLNWAYEPNIQLVYDYTSGVYYSPASGWLYAPHLALYYHPGASWVFDPNTRLVFDYNTGVYFSPDSGWVYVPQMGVFYHPWTGSLFTPDSGGLGTVHTNEWGQPLTGNDLLDQLLAASNATVADNLAFIDQVPLSVYTGGHSLLSPVGQGLATVNGVMADVGGILRGEIDPAEVSRRYHAAAMLNAGDAASQEIRNSINHYELVKQSIDMSRQAESDAALLQIQTEALLQRAP